eukprot:m.1082251 g.1082251  ORF g.1082251 m.1082251 type:complete len:1545 (-) comp24263_c0_seq2:139-4773(-)
MAEAEAFDALDMAEQGIGGEAAMEEDDEGEYSFSRPQARRSGRSRQNTAKEKRKAALDRFKHGREQYNDDDEEADALYDVVDDDEYTRIRQQRIEEDDFIEYDDGDDMGYRDHGGELWDEEDFAHGTDSNAARRAQRGAGGAMGARRARMKKMPKKRISSLFTGGGKSSRLGAAVVKMSEEDGVGNDDEFLKEVLAEEEDFGNEDIVAAEESADKDAVRARKKKRKGGLMKMALFGSSTAAREAYFEQQQQEEEQDDFNDTYIESIPTTSTVAKKPRMESPGTIGSSQVGSPARQRHTPPQKPQFVSPNMSNSRAAANDHMDDPVPMDDDDSTSAPVKHTTEIKQPSPKRRRTKVVQMLTEEEMEAIASATDGSKDHLRVTKAKLDSEDWKKVRRGTHEVHDDVQISADKLPMTEDEDGDKLLRFFWLDAQQGENNTAGTVFLFGKVYSPDAKGYVSCCVSVKNVERNLFVLPREYKLDDDGDVTDQKVEMIDVYQEMDELLGKQGVTTFASKTVERKYAFEKTEVPREATWLKIKYKATFPKVDPTMTGKTFSHVFGANIEPLERFIMKRDLMGPCWLDIRDATPSRRSFSWCKLEADVNDPKLIVKTDDAPASPPLVVLSLSMQTILNRKSNGNEITMVSGLIHSNVECDGPTPDPEKNYAHFSAIRKLGDNPFPFDFSSRCHQTRGKTMEICHSERQLLNFVMTKIARIDPDIIAGHNILGFDLDVLLHRIKDNSIPHWSRIGRLKRAHLPRLSAGLMGGRANYAERALACGRLLVDMKVSSREFLRLTTYEMNELVKTQLGGTRVDVDNERIPAMYQQSETLLQLCDHVERDAWFVMSLLFKLLVLPLSKQIANITGGLLARVFAGGRSERNEYLLCHEFHRRKFIIPDKKGYEPKKSADADDGDDNGDRKKGPRRKKPEYSGGLVLEPKKGFYDKFVLLLDFNSLYPSIIQEYNLCFTTVKRDNLVADAESGEVPMADVPDSGVSEGILPKVVRQLVQRRRQVKALIKSESDKSKLTDYDIRQRALKLTVNSMYGCLGFGASRFHAKPIAALITSKGREILQKTVDLAQDKCNLDVIYGDTDSIMINTRCTDLAETKKIGNQVKREVNSLYKELEIEIDGVFKTMLLLKKKKYAALTIEEKNGKVTIERETKGLDMVRRDWSALSHDVGYYILNQILSRESREDLVEACHDYLRSVAADLDAGLSKVPIEKFIIHKGLTKDPKDYADKKNQPHVQVALRMKAAGKSVKALDTIPYVVCLDGTTNGATQRAYHPDDVRKGTMNLEIDTEYYLKNQIHPVVARLLDPIDGTDSGQIAECLGLDAAQFLHSSSSSFDTTHSEIGMGMMSQMSDAERFKGVNKLKVCCRQCNTTEDFVGVFRQGGEGGGMRCGLLCPNPSCAAHFSVPYLCNQVSLGVRTHVDQYYAMQLTCDDESCPIASRTTRQVSVAGSRCLDPYCRGTMRPVYTDGALYSQLSYYQFLFDTVHALKQLPEETRGLGQSVITGYTETFAKLYEHVDTYLQRSARKHVDLGALFTRLGLKD